MSHLEKVTECEHGSIEEHIWFTPKARLARRCPGGSRVRVEPDYEAAARIVRQHNDGSSVWPSDGASMAKAIVDAALGDTK